VVNDLAPAGAIEQALAERVAGLLWRLRRVERYETAGLAEEQNGAEAEAVKTMRLEAEFRGMTGPGERNDLGFLPDTMKSARLDVSEEKALDRLCNDLAGMPDGSKVPRSVAVALAYACERAAQPDDDADAGKVDIDDVDIPGWPDGASLDDAPWNAGLLRATVQAIADASGKQAAELVADAALEARSKGAFAAKRLADLEADVRARRGEGLMLDGDKPDKVARYEGHLERSLYRALHELQRLQADRGARASAPPALDVDVSMGPRLAALPEPGGPDAA
jgi:hypothetical protein